MDDVVLAIGQTAEVSVVLGGVEQNSFNSFQFQVVSSSPAVEIVAVSRVATLAEPLTFWMSSGLPLVDGGSSSANPIANSGTLVRLIVRGTAAVSNATITLTGIEFKQAFAFRVFGPTIPTANVTVTSQGNRAPSATDDVYSVAEGGSISPNMAAGVLVNDTDADGQPLTAAIGVGPANGTVTLNADGSFTYVHNGGESTSDSFTYTVSDGSLTDSGLVTITVTPVNDPPVANPIATTARASVAKLITLSATDPDDTAFSFAVVTQPAHGTVAISGSTATYTAAAGFTGVDSFTYTANDGEVTSAPATVSLTVTGNTAPVGAADNYSVIEGAILTVPVGTGVLANDSDQDGDPLTATLKTSVTRGSLNLSANGGFTYVHNGSETLSDSFAYTLSDGSAQVDVVVTITINPVNDVPVATGGSAATQQGIPVQIPLSAIDPDSNTLTFVVVLLPIFGDVQIAGSTATYTPNPGFAGADEFAFVANDGTSNSNIATVNVTVLGVARVQFIHNVSDALLDPADIYVDGTRRWDNARFRTATAFTEMAAGRHTIAVAPGTSSSANTSVKTTDLEFANGGTYSVVVSGTIGLDLYLVAIGDARRTGSSPTTVDVRAFNGAPDIAALDVRWMADTKDHSFLFPFATSLPYGTATAYTGQVPRAFNLEARLATGTAIDTYRFDWSSKGGTALLLMGSGLDGAIGTYGFSLMTVDPAGVVGLPVIVTSSDAGDLVPRTFLLRGNFPNPFNPTTSVQFDLPEAAEVSVRMTDLLGREALTTPPESMDAGVNRSIHIDGSTLSSGIYIYRVTARAGKILYTAAGTMTMLK